MRLRFTILTLLLVLLAASCQRQPAEPPVRPAAAKAAARNAKPAAPGRRVFPYSVVSGGVATPAEMVAAVQQDAVVSEHYAGLKPAAFRSEVLAEDRKGYVSYRIRDKVYWSRRLMTIKKGELVLTDGESMLRGRCGNRISPVAMSPVAPEEIEPTEAVLDSSQDSRLLAGIPPVPVASPVGGTLQLDRSGPDDPSAGMLLLPPGSETDGLIVPWANLVSPGGFWIAGGNAVGGGGGGGPIGGGGGAPPPVQPGFPPPGVETGTVPPVVAPPPTTIVPSAPPVPELPIPPETITSLPPSVKPPVIEPPNGVWPPLVSFPPLSIPPNSQPPAVVPPSNPPATPPTGNPPGVPPGTGEPPRSNPPTVSDPPPGFPPSNPPEGDNPVPEPATILLTASALALLGARQYLARRRG